MVVVLAGGTGGAKLARGMADVVGADGVVVVANTGDDIEIYDVHVSPDPDLVTFWLADLIDERGWGIRGDTFDEMDRREAAGEDTWFRLGDRDLELCALRASRMAAGARQTEAHAAVTAAAGVATAVLPMTDEQVRTSVRADGRWLPFQEFMILARGAQPEAVALGGIAAARPSPEVLDALERAEAIVIGPSNPVISIGPILAVPGMKEAIAAAGAPVIAVSPFVGGRAVKGPTEDFCRAAGLPPGPGAVARAYAGIAHAAVADEEVVGLPTLIRDVLLDTPVARAEVARATLEFAASLPRG